MHVCSLFCLVGGVLGRREGVVLKAHMLHVIAVVSSYTDTDTFFCFLFSILKCLL